MSHADDKDIARTLYIVLAIGVLLPIMSVVSAGLAFFYQRSANAVLKTHYQFIVRTFLIGFPFQITGILLVWYLGVGWMILLAWFLWLIARCVQGFRIAGQGRAHPHPKTWGIY